MKCSWSKFANIFNIINFFVTISVDWWVTVLLKCLEKENCHQTTLILPKGININGACTI